MTLNKKSNELLAELEKGVFAALETYSNVHRGSGHYSMVTTHLYEQARDIVLEHLNLSKKRHTVIFCSPRRAEVLKTYLRPGSFECLSSSEFGLSLGVRALAVKKTALPEGAPFEVGGGSTRLISPAWVIWATPPDKFEAGTPPVINAIAFAKALLLSRKYGKEIFRDITERQITFDEILHDPDLDAYSGKELLDRLLPTFIGGSKDVPTSKGIRKFINLDNSASTPTFRPVWDTVRRVWYQQGQLQVEIAEKVRSICAEFLGAPLPEYDLIFTSNATEAINIAASALGRESHDDHDPVIIGTLLEHSSNDLPWRTVSKYPVIRLSINDEGFIDIRELERLLRDYNLEKKHGRQRIRMVAVSGASNVLGSYNNIPEISRLVHQYGAHLLVDGAQLVAHHSIGIAASGIDYFAFSAHKVYAPFGCGMLIVRKGLLNVDKDEMEMIRLSGEENTAGIAALGKSLTLLQRVGMDLIRDKEKTLTAIALTEMAKIKRIRLFGVKNPESQGFANKGGVIVFELKGSLSSKVARQLAEQGGIGVRYGCHCAHILIKNLLGIGPVPARIQGVLVTLIPGMQLPGLVRISFGIQNDQKDVEHLIRVLGNIARKEKPGAGAGQQIKDFVSAASKQVYA